MLVILCKKEATGPLKQSACPDASYFAMLIMTKVGNPPGEHYYKSGVCRNIPDIASSNQKR